MRRLAAVPAVILTILLAVYSNLASVQDSGTRRRGVVRTEGRAFADDGGPFPALGATLFWGAWGYKHDRARLEKNLDFLARHHFDYIRVLGEVGGEHWHDRQVDPRWPDYDAVIAGLTDLAYDRYGLRVEWSIFGGVDFSTTPAAREALIARFARMAAGREHKILLFEIGNESWQNGFPHPQGTAELRHLAARLKAQLTEAGAKPILRAITSPAGPEAYRQSLEDPVSPDPHFGYRATYEGADADVGTVHIERSRSEDGWNPVRQPWENRTLPGMPAAISNDEPVGPDSSVASEHDPMRLVMAAVVTYLSGLAAYTYHTKAGIWGGGVEKDGASRGHGDLWAYSPAIAEGFRAMKAYLPSDLTTWRQLDDGDDGHPFRGSLAASPGSAVRNYAAQKDGRFVAAPIGVRGGLRLRAAYPSSVEVIHPLTGKVLQSRALNAGDALVLEGLPAYVLKGSRR
jgi:hypothetical protein